MEDLKCQNPPSKHRAALSTESASARKPTHQGTAGEPKTKKPRSRLKTISCDCHAAIAKRRHHRCDDESHRLAATFRAWFSCQRRAQTSEAQALTRGWRTASGPTLFKVQRERQSGARESDAMTHIARENRSGANGPEEPSRSRSRVCAISTSMSFGHRWQTIFRRQAPPHLPRHLLFRILAYRLQADRVGRSG